MRIAKAFRLEDAPWVSHCAKLRQVRRRVFVEEQNVPETLELDGLDSNCWHVLACDKEGHPIGTGRLRQDGRIGRLAVLKPWRGQGVGTAMMRRLLELARCQGLAEVTLHAQTSALDFYAELGFTGEGTVFLEADIPHQRMRLSLANLTSRRFDDA